jgi:hypothetical protein
MPRTEAQNKWVERNREYYNEMQNLYTKVNYQKNREARIEYAKEYRLKNLEVISQKQKERYQRKKALLAAAANAASDVDTAAVDPNPQI